MDGEIVVCNEASRTTGGHTWPAAHVLVDFICKHRGDAPTGRSILELGSGTGEGGLNIARRLRGECVVLTDQSAQLSLLRKNVEANRHLVRCSVTVGELDFLLPTPPSILQQSFDLILASDVVYTKEVAEGLPLLLRRLLDHTHDKCVVVMAHTLRRFDDFDNIFFQSTLDSGLSVRELSLEDGRVCGEVPWCGEIELFPDQRIAILEIAKQ